MTRALCASAMAFIASSDNHTARPGTGYKQYERRMMTESTGVRSKLYDWIFRRRMTQEQEDPLHPRIPENISSAGLFQLDVERVSSFLYPGGLVAVHSDGRNRESIWQALKSRHVYGTSGPRILLWFDLLNAPQGELPMGSETTMKQNPRFEVRAQGAFVQHAGCPDSSINGLSKETSGTTMPRRMLQPKQFTSRDSGH